MNKKRSIILVIIWMSIIFIFSSFNSDTSTEQSNTIVNIIANLFNINNIELLSLIIRKMAHFMEYFILGVLVLNMLRYTNKSITVGIIICILYAISDELHQILTPGRTFKIYDIIIDSLGSVIAILGFKKIIK